MKRPLFVRSLTEAEQREALAQEVGSRDALTQVVVSSYLLVQKGKERVKLPMMCVVRPKRGAIRFSPGSNRE